MPLPEGVRPEPDRPFITVRTATSHHDPDEIRRYATREECLTDLHRWQEVSLVRQDPYYHLGIGYQGDDSTYTFEVYDIAELRLQLNIDRKGRHETGAWAAEQHFRTITDTPENTWETIKADYATLFETAASNLAGLPYQEGFEDLHAFARKAFDAAHYPDRQEGKLKALVHTLDTCAQHKIAINDLHANLFLASEALDGLLEKMSNSRETRIEHVPRFFEWLKYRDTVIAEWTQALVDPDLSQHLPRFDYNAMKAHLHRLADPSVPTLFDPDLKAARRTYEFSSAMEDVAFNYTRSLRNEGQADLIPYCAYFDDLQASIEDAISASTDNPKHLGALCTLQAQLSISFERREAVRAALDELTDVSTRIIELRAWSTSNDRPIHQAPDFDAWRTDADNILKRCELMRSHYPSHFKRSGASEDSVATAFDLLRDSRFQRPPSPEQIAAQRQARAETHRESASMSV